MTSQDSSSKHIMERTLPVVELASLAAKFQTWRTTQEIREAERRKGSGLVLPFVKGLWLSAGLVYVLRNIVGESGLKVDWGQLTDESSSLCSPECDVIIHRGHYARWNDHTEPVMDFKFVRCTSAVAVVSCKSYASSIDREYSRKLRPYVSSVFLFSECCAPERLKSLRSRAGAAGYCGFCCLYTYNEKSGECVTLPDVWLEFLSGIRSAIEVPKRG